MTNAHTTAPEASGKHRGTRRPSIGAGRLGVAIAVLVAAGMLPVGPASRAADAGGHEKPAFSEKLPNVPGKTLTAIVVNYAPGGNSPSHRHAGSVFAYVLSGAIRSENSATGPARIYKAGESFFEPPGSTHLVSENASATEPASLLAVFIADDGARLTRFDK
jgi:quercetin dioxygenase-like cupin family protein